MNAQRKHTSGATDSQLRKLLQCGFYLAGLGLGLLASGCSTAEMKGTPFYSGEYSKRQGPAEQRVNVWPAFYYREPALSVLWPVFELTEDHAAVRPLFSVYGLDRPNQQYNVLWPLAQFDRQTGDNRIVPLFWGDDYRVLFPLYWHFGAPWGAPGGFDSLFPLWMLSRHESKHFDLYSPWPLVRFWSDQKKQVEGSMVLPLYWQQSDEWIARFYSPFWLSEHEQNGDYWRLLVPLYYEMQAGDNNAFVTPLWAQGRSERGDWHGMLPFWMYSGNDAGRYDLSCPWPLVRFWSDERALNRGSRVLPLYWQQHEAGASQFFSLPWSSGSDASSFWRLMPPLFCQSSNAASAKLITPLWAQGRDGKNEWDALLPLWFRSWESTNRFSLYAPLAHFWSDTRKDERGSTVIPLYWQQSRKGSSQFYSPLWLSDTEPNGDYWQLLPPLFYQESARGRSMLITPLWAQGKSETNDWASVIPFFYWDRQQDELLSPLWAHWRKVDTETWLAPWALSWQTRTPERNDLTLLGGLAHASWGDKPGADYLFPLFYNDSGQGTQLSPLWLRWREAETETTVVPALLSWQTREPERTDLWLAGGLARASWGENPGADYLFPLFYHDTGQLLTPLVGWDRTEGYCYFATPLAGVYTGNHSGSWAFPFYSFSRDTETGNAKGKYLLLGSHTKTEAQTRSWLIPFFYYQNRLLPEHPDVAKRSPTYGQNFWCLPMCWYRNQFYLRSSTRTGRESDEVAMENSSDTNTGPTVESARPQASFIRDYTQAHGVFPLWSYEAQSTPTEGRSNRDTSVLLWLYDYKHQVGPRPGVNSGATNDYTRARVLWRLWHYERNNGTVSVDVFPSFTYDRKPDGFKKVSFFWRFFRYERDPDGDRKLDLFFVPLQR
jgi:hypothetical protein